MKKKMKLFALIAMIAIMILPTAAFALSGGSPGLSDYRYGTGDASQARNYAIAFGTEPYLDGNSLWPVYSAPNLDAVRGSNGRAMLCTDDEVYTAGWSGSWLMVRYPKDNGGFRVGWVPKHEINREIKRSKACDFAYWTVTVGKNCTLTDDPLYESEALAYASSGETLTYLGYYQYGNGREYAYVQGDLNGRPVCGFIPFEAIAW